MRCGRRCSLITSNLKCLEHEIGIAPLTAIDRPNRLNPDFQGRSERAEDQFISALYRENG